MSPRALRLSSLGGSTRGAQQPNSPALLLLMLRLAQAGTCSLVFSGLSCLLNPRSLLVLEPDRYAGLVHVCFVHCLVWPWASLCASPCLDGSLCGSFCCRLGEASNPGPCPDKQRSLHEFFSTGQRKPGQQTPACSSPRPAASQLFWCTCNPVPSPERQERRPRHRRRQKRLSDLQSCGCKIQHPYLTRSRSCWASNQKSCCYPKPPPWTARNTLSRPSSAKQSMASFGVPQLRLTAMQKLPLARCAGVRSAQPYCLVFPLRVPFTALPQDLLDTQRVTVGHVRVGPLHLRCIAGLWLARQLQ